MGTLIRANTVLCALRFPEGIGVGGGKKRKKELKHDQRLTPAKKYTPPHPQVMDNPDLDKVGMLCKTKWNDMQILFRLYSSTYNTKTLNITLTNVIVFVIIQSF